MKKKTKKKLALAKETVRKMEDLARANGGTSHVIGTTTTPSMCCDSAMSDCMQTHDSRPCGPESP